jgi:hypothetical protein
MFEYGISFVEIERTWTDDQFFALLDAMGERYRAQNEASDRSARKSSDSTRGTGQSQVISIHDLKAQGTQRQK